MGDIRFILSVFALFLIDYSYLVVFVKAVEDSCMYKWIPVNKLTEGDWVAKPVYVNKKIVCVPKDLGLELKQIKALKKAKVKKVYVKEGITIWINNWEKNNWKTKDKKNVKNVDLWKSLKELVKNNQVEWNWIKGHSENPMNELADTLAKKATPV